MDLLAVFIILSFFVYRINRFIIRDTIFDRPRAALINWLLPKRGGAVVVDLITCPFCIGVWVAGVSTAVAANITNIPIPVYLWLASAAGSMVVWKVVEDD